MSERERERKKRRKEKGNTEIGEAAWSLAACSLQAVRHFVLAGLSQEAVPAEVTALLTVASRNPRNTLIASLVIL